TTSSALPRRAVGSRLRRGDRGNDWPECRRERGRSPRRRPAGGDDCGTGHAREAVRGVIVTGLRLHVTNQHRKDTMFRKLTEISGALLGAALLLTPGPSAAAPPHGSYHGGGYSGSYHGGGYGGYHGGYYSGGNHYGGYHSGYYYGGYRPYYYPRYHGYY